MHFNMLRTAQTCSKHSELYLSTGGDMNQMFGGHRQVVRLKWSTGRGERTTQQLNNSHRTASSWVKFRSLNYSKTLKQFSQSSWTACVAVPLWPWRWFGCVSGCFFGGFRDQTQGTVSFSNYCRDKCRGVEAGEGWGEEAGRAMVDTHL